MTVVLLGHCTSAAPGTLPIDRALPLSVKGAVTVSAPPDVDVTHVAQVSGDPLVPVPTKGVVAVTDVRPPDAPVSCCVAPATRAKMPAEVTQRSPLAGADGS